MLSTENARVWLACGAEPGQPAPSNATWLCDDTGRLWIPDGRGCWHTEDNRDHTTLTELRGRTDLVEVLTSGGER